MFRFNISVILLKNIFHSLQTFSSVDLLQVPSNLGQQGPGEGPFTFTWDFFSSFSWVLTTDSSFLFL